MADPYTSMTSHVHTVVYVRLALAGMLVFGTACRQPSTLPAGRPPRQHLPGNDLEAVFGGLCGSEEEVQRLQRIAANLDQDCGCQCRLLGSPQPNAFSFSDGRVYITRGLYGGLDDRQLAAVIAHELGHIKARHGRQPDPSTPSVQLAREMEADRLAVTMLRRAGCQPRVLGALISRLAAHQPQGWSDQRIAALPDAE